MIGLIERHGLASRHEVLFLARGWSAGTRGHTEGPQQHAWSDDRPCRRHRYDRSSVGRTADALRGGLACPMAGVWLSRVCAIEHCAQGMHDAEGFACRRRTARYKNGMDRWSGRIARLRRCGLVRVGLSGAGRGCRGGNEDRSGQVPQGVVLAGDEACAVARARVVHGSRRKGSGAGGSRVRRSTLACPFWQNTFPMSLLWWKVHCRLSTQLQAVENLYAGSRRAESLISGQGMVGGPV